MHNQPWDGRMKRTIYIYSACDRFNYGDLLFPIILKNLFLKSFGDKYDIEVLGTIESDLSSYGALKTKPIRQIFSSKHPVDGSILIIGGGEVLPISWNMICSLLDCFPADVVNVVKKISRKFNFLHTLTNKLCNIMSRRMLCPNLRYPFLVSNSDFKSNVKVIYNTIGCTMVKSLPISERGIIREKLLKTSYVSVRESASVEALSELNLQRERIHLAPDSAIVCSEVFTKGEILNLALSATRDFIQKNSNNYICFQVSEHSARGKYSLIAEQLQQISHMYNMPILLLPIGYVHGDQTALELLKKEIKAPTIMPSHASVFNIMASIAFCRIFIGTSLHGNITALSFGVPHLGLGPKGGKLDLFLNTWDIPEQAECALVTKFAQRINAIMTVSSGERNSNRDEMVDKYRQCFRNIVGIIEG